MCPLYCYIIYHVLGLLHVYVCMLYYTTIFLRAELFILQTFIKCPPPMYQMLYQALGIHDPSLLTEMRKHPCGGILCSYNKE